MLGADLSKRLLSIHNARGTGKQFYVSQVPAVGNPSFDHEPGYENLKFPDSGFQLLGLYRFWNIIEYWSPYRDLVGQKWDSVLAEFIPRIMKAKDSEAYALELLALVSKAHDGHANLWSALHSRPPLGKCLLPLNVRFVENNPVIIEVSATDTSDALAAPKVGDVITKLDGVPVTELVENWTPYYAASNESARLNAVAQFMPRGKCGQSTISVLRDGHESTFNVSRATPNKAGSGVYTHDLPGDTFRLLSKDVAYLKLSSVKAADVEHYIEQATGTKGLIIDIRNYPSEFVVFALGSLFVEKETAFVRFTQGDLSNPGAFHWTMPLSLSPKAPHYFGKVVILVDEISMSQAEYTSMALRAAPGATVVGDTTAGADGNVSPFALPGGIRTAISGIGIYYPNKAPTQRVGILPDVRSKPTIAGISAGRDEILEEALRQILGQHVPTGDIEKMAKP